MKKLFFVSFALICLFIFSFSVFADSEQIVYLDPNAEYFSSELSVSDNSSVYVSGKNLCPINTIESTISVPFGNIRVPLNFCANSSLSFSADVKIFGDDDSSSNASRIYVYYSDGTSQLYSLGQNVLVNDDEFHHLTYTFSTSSEKVISYCSILPFYGSRTSNRHAIAKNIQLEIGASSDFEPYKTILSYEYPYQDLSFLNYSYIYTSTGGSISFNSISALYGDSRDFSLPVSLVSGWVTDFFSVVFSTWWSSVLVCLPLVYAVFCLILKIFNIKFGDIRFGFLKFVPFRKNVYNPHSYSYIRFRIFHPVRYLQILLESRGEKSVKKELLLQELNRRSRARNIFSIDEDIKSVRIDGKLYYNPNGVYVTYHHNKVRR